MAVRGYCLPVFVNDDGWSLDVVTTWQLLPQIHTGVQVTFLKVTLGHLQRRIRDKMATRYPFSDRKVVFCYDFFMTLKKCRNVFTVIY